MPDQLSQMFLDYCSKFHGCPMELDYISPYIFYKDCDNSQMIPLNLSTNVSQISSISVVEQQPTANSRRQHWTQEQSDYLAMIRQQFPKYTFRDIANLLNLKFGTNYSASQCQQRFQRVADPALNKGRFTAEEDAKIIQLFNKYDGQIKLIAREMENRQVGQIRRHLQVLGLVD